MKNKKNIRKKYMNTAKYEELFDMFENGTEEEKKWAEMAIENRFFYWSSHTLNFPGETKCLK